MVRFEKTPVSPAWCLPAECCILQPPTNDVISSQWRPGETACTLASLPSTPIHPSIDLPIPKEMDRPHFHPRQTAQWNWGSYDRKE